MEEDMQERVEKMFDKMYPMTDGVKKASYEKWMTEFRERHGDVLLEMTEAVKESGNQTAEAEKIAALFADVAESLFSKRGKISSRKQVDINCFMIYYIFPAILLTQSACAVILADAIRDEWRKRFKNSRQLAYTDYDTIYKSFNDKIFGMF